MDAQPARRPHSPSAAHATARGGAGERHRVDSGTRRWLDPLWRTIGRLESERACWGVLGVAMALSAGLGLWLTRGTTFFLDELTYFVANRGFDPEALLTPHKGHLIAVPRLIYATVFKLFGPDYLVFRLIQVLGIALVAGLFFALAKRRIGAAAALAPSTILLFFGSGWVSTLSPVGITHVYCLAAGLGALLALERGSRRGDVACCVLVTVSVATFSIGLAFLAGVAVSVLLRADRWRRAWMFLVPAVLYGAWYVAAPKLKGPEFAELSTFKLSNALLIPNYVADTAAAVGAAVTGLSYHFTDPNALDSSWGYVVVAIAVAALVLRVRRGNVSGSLWTSLAIVVAFWASAAMVTTATPLLARLPGSDQYIYAGGVGALLVATAAARGIRFSRHGLLALFAITAFALMTNLAQLRSGGSVVRAYSTSLPAALTALVVARDHVDPNYSPPLFPSFAYPAGPLLAAVERSGSFGPSIRELRRESEPVREVADATLAGALRLRLVPGPTPKAGQKCLRLGRRGAGPLDLTVRPPGALLRSATPAAVTLRRFAGTAKASAGGLTPTRFAALLIPRDRAPDPWHAVVSTGGPVTVCQLGATG